MRESCKTVNGDAPNRTDTCTVLYCNLYSSCGKQQQQQQQATGLVYT